MFKKIIVLSVVLSVVLTLSSCANKGITLGKTEVISYESLGNGVAEISLKLYENNTFLFSLNSIPQPEIEDDPIEISEIGTYSADGDWKVLNFQNQKFNLPAIFDEEFLDANEFQVIDEHTLRLNTNHRIIPIWGISCERKK